MQVIVSFRAKNYRVNLDESIDISIPVGSSEVGVKAWYLAGPKIEPVVNGEFVGEVAKGGSVNFRNIQFNPHAHGTHTECMGHISESVYSINRHMKSHYFIARLVSVKPAEKGNDRVITQNQLQNALGTIEPEALIIRTLPNNYEKLTTDYSYSNPAYLDENAALWLSDIGVQHLLIDTPSIDREEDGGTLRAHKAFWDFPNLRRLHCTITEFVFVPDSVPDASYFLNLQTAPFENDATPSRPILHKMTLID